MPSASAAAPPGPPVRSVTSTLAPASAALKAAADPAAPRPTTTPSASSAHEAISELWHGVTSVGSRTIVLPPTRILPSAEGSRSGPATRPHPLRCGSAPPPAPPPLLQRLAPEWTPSLAYQLVPTLTTWRLTHPD